MTDHLQWLGKGVRVAQHLHCDPSTVSRKVESCCQFYGVKTVRQLGEWQVVGDRRLMHHERQLHQQLRLHSYAPLRLSLPAQVGRVLAPAVPINWDAVEDNLLGIQRPLQLLQDRVIDAWLCTTGEELGSWHQGEYRMMPLAELKLDLLTHQERGPASLEDLRQNPEASVLMGQPALLPRRDHWVAGMGLLSTLIDGQRYEASQWERPVNKGLAVVPGTALDRCVRAEWRPLKGVTPLLTSVCVVTLHDLSESTAVQQLVEACSHRIRQVLQSSATPEDVRSQRPTRGTGQEAATTPKMHWQKLQAM